MKEKIKIIILIILNILFVFVTLWSIMIYTSLMNKQLPWYEPCGMQFMAILILSCPAFIVLGIGELILGKFISISKTLRFLPLLCCVGMGLPIFIDDGLGFGMQLSGTIIGISVVLLTICFTFIDVLKLNKISNHKVEQRAAK